MISQIPFFMAPNKIITPEKTYEFPLPESKVKPNFFTNPGFVYQIKGVRESLIKGRNTIGVQSSEYGNVTRTDLIL